MLWTKEISTSKPTTAERANNSDPPTDLPQNTDLRSPSSAKQIKTISGADGKTDPSLAVTPEKSLSQRPDFLQSSYQVVLKQKKSWVIFRVQSHNSQILWEVARDNQFSSVIDRKQTSIYALKEDFKEPGNFFVRARGVSRKGELTDWSEPAPITVFQNSGREVASDETSLPSQPVSPQQAVQAAPAENLDQTQAPQPPKVSALDAQPSQAPKSKDNVNLAKAPDHPTPAPRCEDNSKIGLRAFLGLGINYVRYTENLTDVSTSYADFRGPSTHLGIGMDLTDHYAIEADYKDTPFQFNNASVGLPNTFGDWQTLLLQVTQKSDGASAWTDRYFNDKPGQNEISWLYGVQLHQLPIPLFSSSTEQPLLKTVQIFDLSAGARWQRYWNANTRTTMLLHLQYPIASSSSTGGSSFQVNPVIFFDGSIGVDKRLKDHLWLGLHWYGQYQQFNFSYSDSQISDSGAQSTFFSDLELRLMFDF